MHRSTNYIFESYSVSRNWKFHNLTFTVQYATNEILSYKPVWSETKRNQTKPNHTYVTPALNTYPFDKTYEICWSCMKYSNKLCSIRKKCSLFVTFEIQSYLGIYSINLDVDVESAIFSREKRIPSSSN